MVQHRVEREGPYEAVVLAQWRGQNLGRFSASYTSIEQATIGHSILSALLPNVDPLRSLLEKVNGNADRLESFVQRLFASLGCWTMILGKGLDAADIIAYRESGPNVWLIEATLRNIGQGNKIAKVALRAQELTESTGMQVRPVLVTALARNQVSQHEFSQAAKDSIVVLTREDLENLSKRSSHGLDASELTIWMRKRLALAPE